MTRSTSGQSTGLNGGPAAVPDRIARVRGRVLKGVVSLALGGIVFAVVVVWQRDTTHMRKSLEMLEPFQRTLQATLDYFGQIPLRAIDRHGNPLPSRGFTYPSIDAAQALRSFDGPIMLGYTPHVSTGLRTDGRAVLILEQGRCEIRWFSRAEFRAWKRRQDTWVRDR